MIELNNTENKLGLLNIIVIVLSLYVMGALIVDSVFILPKETSTLLNYIDNSICAFFFFEFSIRFYKAESKLKFLKNKKIMA